MMQLVRTVVAGAAVLGLAVCAGGCNVGKPAPAPSPSASYTACANNLEAFVKRTELAQQLFIQQRGVGSASGSSSGQMHANKSLSCDLRGTSEDVDQFMKNLRTEFQRPVQQQGGQLDEPIDGETAGDPLGSFELNYAAGNAHGK